MKKLIKELSSNQTEDNEKNTLSEKEMEILNLIKENPEKAEIIIKLLK